jgi:hypothetical protein
MTPPAFVPIDWNLIRDTLWQWFTEAAGCETIFADQNAPQPAYPYASLNFLPGLTEFGASDEERIQPDGSLALVGRRDFMLSCQIHGGTYSSDANCDPLSRAFAVIASTAIPQYLNAFIAANVAVWNRGQPQMLDVQVGTEWVKRALVEIRFGTMSYVNVTDWPNLAEVGWFDKVQISSQIEPLRGSGGLNLDEEILDPNA